MTQMEERGSGFVNLFTNLSVKCDSEISKISYYSASAKNFFVSLWMQLPNSSYILQNQIKVVHNKQVMQVNVSNPSEGVN